ncbi:hypothetical protein DPMN_004044 [Dreissena polymorpha]|uniref:Uncharacterized protein n=1 Tax=Dreissena polymorpha TaxID=45954 RepID=A0A9D4MPL0_DREPO|nr:hypothetical protein DPMN_004044 [Dreissena polymorpha]
MTEEMQNLCTLSAPPVTSEYSSAMQEFTDLVYTSSPQHKDSTEVCIKRDVSDLEKMHTKITNCSPYTADHSLKKQFQFDSGWIRCECSCVSGGWEQYHKRYHRKVDLCFINLRDKTDPKILGTTPLLRLLKTVLLILPFCFSVSRYCQNLELFPLNTYCHMI